LKKPFDLLLTGGRVIDPAQGIDDIRDVAFAEGKVAAVGGELKSEDAQTVADMSGFLVVPGLIDLHTHVYWGATAASVEADPVCLNTGTCTFVDAGSAGPGNFAGMKRFIIEESHARVLAFLNISYAGIFGVGPGMLIGENQDLRMLNAGAAVAVAEQNPDVIVGIKVRASLSAGDPSVQPVYMARTVADRIGKPMMVHMGLPPPLVEEILPLMRPGDILTHVFKSFPNSILDGRGRPIEQLRAAKDRGVILDVGHGAGAFSFEVAKTALDQGIVPDTISTDLHVLNISGPVYDLPTTLTKFLTIGMDLVDVIRCATENPARVLGWDDRIGHLGLGAEGDATVLALKEEETPLYDASGASPTERGSTAIVASRVLRHVATIRKGEILSTNPEFTPSSSGRGRTNE
jgi:dihydroorotase